MSEINHKLRKEIYERDNFTCQKCGFLDKTKRELKVYSISPTNPSEEININNLVTLCSICFNYAPKEETLFREYLEEKIDGTILETFRKKDNSISRKTKIAMGKKVKEGEFITRAPKGYKLEDKKLIIDEEEAKKVVEIFNKFLNENTNLTRLAKEYNFSTTGIKKLLKNTTYIGKVKFAGKEMKGNHQPIIDEETFKSVQRKFSKIKIN